LTAWTDPEKELPVMKPDRFHSRQTDPVYSRHPHPNGSWVGAVEISDGSILLLGALGLEAHVDIHDGGMNGWHESNHGEWLVAIGNEDDVFTYYTNELARRFGRGRIEKTPRVWCSWYSLYKKIDEEKIRFILRSLDKLPFDVIQIDDGWQTVTGDWTPNQKFPSGMSDLASKIHSTGRKAGLWLAPLVISEKSRLFKEHADWLLKDMVGKPVSSGYEWGGKTYAIDATHPEAADWLANIIRTVRTWGYEYLKLDFLYAGALPGKRFLDLPREAAYRHALGIMRQAAGDAYLLTCGAPILPSIGLCDAIRVGPDVARTWDSHLYSYLLYNQTTPGVKNAIRTTVNRLWLKPLVHIDPDVAYFHEINSLNDVQRQLFEDLTEVCEFKGTSDLPGSWTNAEYAKLENWLTHKPDIKHIGRNAYSIGTRKVDFSLAIDLPPKPGGFDIILRWILAWLGNQIWVLRLWDILFRVQPDKINL
jgi:alpha-galactosidase